MIKRLNKDDALAQEIADAYFIYFEAYTRRNWDEMYARFADDITMIGTGVDELCHSGESTLAAFRREFDQSPSPIRYELKSLEVFQLAEDLAMLMITMDVCFHNKLELVECPNNRTTAIMVRENGSWLLAHGHWSQPDRDIDVGESVPYRLLLKKSHELEEKVAERTSKIEAQKEQLRKLNQTKDKMFSIISHDLRNPFNSIMGLSTVLLDEFERLDKTKTREILEVIIDQAQRTHDLLENLLQWAKSQTDTIYFRPAPLRLDQVVSHVRDHMELLARDKELSIALSLPGDVQVRADRHLLEIILRNLMHNAIKFSHQGGRIVVEAEKQGQHIEIAVVDEGQGMSESVRRDLMTDLTGRVDQGHLQVAGGGLGLLLCQEFIHRHGGRLEIESEEGSGSRFSFTLPVG